MQTRKFGALTSSVDPNAIAATVSGLLIASASLIVILAGHLGFSLTVEQVTTYAGALGTSIGAIVTIFGLLRKVVVAIQQKFFPGVNTVSSINPVI